MKWKNDKSNFRRIVAMNALVSFSALAKVAKEKSREKKSTERAQKSPRLQF